MGLDMYLSAEKYVKDWAHNYEDGAIPDDTPAKQIQTIIDVPFPVSEVRCQVMYWRKANHIHNWFVNNVQGGEDNCESHYVSVTQLAALVQVCKDVLNDRSKAAELLPTASGFFFGGTEYDDYYFDDIERTIAALEKLVADPPENLTFYYQSSW